MNEDNKRGASDNSTYSNSNNSTPTTYTYDFQKSSADLRASYEKELGNHMDMMQPSMGGGNRSKRSSRNSARTMIASFLIGAVVIGGFSYMADKNNLFSGGEKAGLDVNGSVASSSGQQDAGVTTAGLSTSDDIASVYEAASPAVVKVENYADPEQSASMMDGSIFGQFFGGDMSGMGGPQQQQEQQQQEQQQQQSTEEQSAELELAGTGTGFFFEEDGYILTNEHVIADADEVKVTVQGYDEPLVAKVMGSSSDLDLAVLKVESPDGEDFHALTLGNSDETQIGDWVIAIGNPYGFDQTLTMGVLSAKERPITISDEEGDHEYEHLLQTDASINPGNSGGPLLNESGEVIGINTAVNAEAQGIGFAIPTSTITEVLEQLKTNTL